MTTDIEKIDTQLAIAPEQTGFTDTQVAMIKQMGLEKASPGDLDLFFHVAKRSGLDPFARQIHMVGRNAKEGDRWVTKFTIQTGIDGYRLIGHRTARRRGDAMHISEPLWRGKDSAWDDVWLSDKPPAAAKVSVVVNGQAFTAVAMYAEYVQTTRDGKPTSMWAKMPANQLAKCAEAAAWRKAYPADFSGVLMEDAVQIIDSDGNPQPRVSRGRGVSGLKAALIEPEPAPVAVDENPPATEEQRAELFRAMDQAKIGGNAERAAYIADVIGREVSHAHELTHADVVEVMAALSEAAAS